MRVSREFRERLLRFRRLKREHLLPLLDGAGPTDIRENITAAVERIKEKLKVRHNLKRHVQDIEGPPGRPEYVAAEAALLHYHNNDPGETWQGLVEEGTLLLNMMDHCLTPPEIAQFIPTQGGDIDNDDATAKEVLFGGTDLMHVRGLDRQGREVKKQAGIYRKKAKAHRVVVARHLLGLPQGDVDLLADDDLLLEERLINTPIRVVADPHNKDPSPLAGSLRTMSISHMDGGLCVGLLNDWYRIPEAGRPYLKSHNEELQKVQEVVAHVLEIPQKSVLATELLPHQVPALRNAEKCVMLNLVPKKGIYELVSDGIEKVHQLPEDIASRIRPDPEKVTYPVCVILFQLPAAAVQWEAAVDEALRGALATPVQVSPEVYAAALASRDADLVDEVVAASDVLLATLPDAAEEEIDSGYVVMDVDEVVAASDDARDLHPASDVLLATLPDAAPSLLPDDAVLVPLKVTVVVPDEPLDVLAAVAVDAAAAKDPVVLP